MATLVKTFTSDGREKKELTFRGKKFEYTMVPDRYGKTGDRKGFEYQVEEEFPDTSTEELDELAEIGFADDDEIGNHLEILTYYEERE